MEECLLCFLRSPLGFHSIRHISRIDINSGRTIAHVPQRKKKSISMCIIAVIICKASTEGRESPMGSFDWKAPKNLDVG